MIQIPDFNTKKELFEFLRKNKESLISQKKAEIKHADSVVSSPILANAKGEALKADDPGLMDNAVKVLKGTLVINTTNYLDSHRDVHLPGLWDKSLKERKDVMHVREHESRKFDYIISDGDDLKAYTKKLTWMEMGYPWPGQTEALIFDSTIRKSRNEFMFDQYRKGYVKQHSVGMLYVKLVLCINDEEAGAEYEAWEKYYSEIVNKDLADDFGYFWVCKEAKVVEGSAVPRGSNMITPTISIEELKHISEPGNHSGNEVTSRGTTREKSVDYNYLTKALKTIKI